MDADTVDGDDNDGDNDGDTGWGTAARGTALACARLHSWPWKGTAPSGTGIRFAITTMYRGAPVASSNTHVARPSI